MEIPYTILFLGGLIFFSHIANSFFDKIKVPNVLLLLLIGIVIGPVTGWVSRDIFGSMGLVFTNITLIIILFESGSSLKFGALKRAIGSATVITLVNFLLSIVLVTLVVNAFTSLGWMSSIFLGAIIGGTSSAVVIPMVKQLQIGERSTNILSLESALSDVLCLVIGLAVLAGMEEGVIRIGDMLNTIWKSFLLAALIGLAGGYGWSVLIKTVRAFENAMFTTPAFLFILFGIVEMLHLNGGIAALCFGIVLGNTDTINKSRFLVNRKSLHSSGFSYNERNFFSEIVFILQTYFFVYVGINIVFSHVTVLLLGLILVVLIILTRTVSIRLISKKGDNLRDITIMSVLSPKGLVPAVLASVPLQLGLVNGGLIQELGYSVVLLSIVISSVLIIIVSKDPLIFFRVTHNKKKRLNETEAENQDIKLPANEENQDIK